MWLMPRTVDNATKWTKLLLEHYRIPLELDSSSGSSEPGINFD